MIIFIIIYIVAFIITYFIYRNIKPNTEPPLNIKNIVLVNNSDLCDNKCLHIHHWAFLLGLLVFIIIFNYVIGYNKWNKYYNYCLILILGTGSAELLIFGPSIFTFNRPCFVNCNMKKTN